MAENETPSPPKGGGRLKRLVPLVVIAVGVAVAFQAGLVDALSFQNLYVQRTEVQGLVDDNGLLALVAYAILYAVVVAFSLPAGAALTVLAGFLFGPIAGGLAVIVGATVGATAIFLAARTALGDALRARAGPFLTKMQAGFEENALSYMLVLRLVPLFPFWLVNIVPAFMGVGVGVYVVTTFFGIMPGTFVFAWFGRGLDSIFDACDAAIAADPNAVCQLPPASQILTPDILIALLGLAVISLIPVVYKKIKVKGSAPADSP